MTITVQNSHDFTFSKYKNEVNMEIDFANSLPLAIKCSIEPCLPLINSLSKCAQVQILKCVHFLLEKPIFCTLIFIFTLAVLTPILSFILSMFIGTICVIFILCILEGLFIACALFMMSSFLSCILCLILVTYLIYSKRKSR